MGRVRVAGPPHSSPGRGVSLSRPRAGLLPVLARGRVASLSRPRAGLLPVLARGLVWFCGPGVLRVVGCYWWCCVLVPKCSPLRSKWVFLAAFGRGGLRFEHIGVALHSFARAPGPPRSSPGRGVSLSRPRAGSAPLFAGGVVLRSPAGRAGPTARPGACCFTRSPARRAPNLWHTSVRRRLSSVGRAAVL